MPRIAVLDDSRLMRNLLQAILEEAGHEVETWVDATAAEISARIESGKPDLLITDYQMPGCNGLTVARLARKANPDLPVLVVTSTHDPDVLAALQHQDVSGILHKPIGEKDLLGAVDAALRSGRGLPSPA
ncbi:MAG TPA: response regulator [Holophagaceae bacterium]|nr:response regulator [Holophagaceae bacterium]